MRLATITAAIVLAACHKERLIEPPIGPGPVVTIHTFADQSYDEDGDGTLDLRVDWKDSAGVDVAGVQLRLLHAADTISNLLRSWTVVQLDSTGLRAKETTQHLLPGGHTSLELRVPTRDGRATTDTISLDLPYARLVQTLETGFPVGFYPAQYMTICPDDHLLYVTVNSTVWIVDPDSLESVALVPTPYSTTASLMQPLCFDGDPYLYVTEDRVRRLNRLTRQWESSIAASYESIAFAASRRDPHSMYEGESIAGVIGIVSRSGLPRGRLLRYSRQTDIYSIAVLPGDQKLYAALGEWGGIIVVDPARDTILKTIDVAPGADDWAGHVEALVLSPDDRRLYATAEEGTPTGVLEIDTRTDSILRTIHLDGHPEELAISPDGRMLFVTTYDASSVPSHNVLFDTRSMTVLQLLPRPRAAGSRRYDRGVTFRSDGRYAFVAKDTDLDIYLIRPVR